VPCRLAVNDASSNCNGGHQERDCYCRKQNDASILPHAAISPLITPTLPTVMPIAENARHVGSLSPCGLTKMWTPRAGSGRP
jgi:hypothetical protein